MRFSTGSTMESIVCQREIDERCLKQREYYIACDMDLDVAIRNGYNICTMVRYNKEELQRHKNAATGNEEDRKVLLSCFGGYNPMLSRRDGLIRHLKGERTIIACVDWLHLDVITLIVHESTNMILGLNVHLSDVTVRIRKRLCWFSLEGPTSLAIDQLDDIGPESWDL